MELVAERDAAQARLVEVTTAIERQRFALAERREALDGAQIDLAQAAAALKAFDAALAQRSEALGRSRVALDAATAEGERLALIHGVYSSVLQVASAALLNPFRDEEWSAAFKELLARLTHYPGFERLSDDLTAMRAEVEVAAAKWYAAARLL